MRKILLMLCLLLGHAAATFAATYVLDANTLQTPSSGTASFNNGLTITNGGGKKLQAQSGTPFLKFSNGVQYTVSGIPSGETVESVVFYGFPHDAGDQCYLAEFNGVTEDPSVADFSDGTAESPKAYDFQGWAIKGSFTFTARTAQTCLWVKITTTTDKVLKFEKDAYSFDLTDLTANGHMPEPIANTTGSTVTYSSSDPTVAACLDGGKPRIKSPGTTTITATAGGVSASYTLTVTSPKATYDLTGNAFEVKSIGTLDKKSFSLDGLTFTFGGDAESPVAVAQPDLGVGVMSLDYNGYSFFSNDLSNPMGSYIVLTTTKAGTLNVRGNFANSSSVGWSHVYKQSDKSAVNNFTQGSGYQSVHLDANTTYYLTTWRADDQYPTFYLKGISYTTDDAQSANQTYSGGTLASGNGYQWAAKKGQKITITGKFGNGMKRYNLDFTNIVDMNTGAEVKSANIAGSVSYLVENDGYVTMKNNSGVAFTLESVVLKNSTPVLSFEKGATSTVSVNDASFTNVVNNAPAASDVTYAITAQSNATATIDASTGKLTNFTLTNGATSGSITVTATSSAIGYYNQGTGTYTLNIINLYFPKTTDNVTLETSGAVSYTQAVQGAPEGVIPVYSFQVTSGTPVVGLEQEQGSADYNLTIKGTGTIVVTATCGTATASYTLTVSGLTFADVSPSISVDDLKDGYTFSQQPEDVSVKISKWEIINKSTTISSANINATSGVISNIQGHGVIVVKATTTDSKTAGYVLTVADRATDTKDLVWDFCTKGNLPEKFGTAPGDATTGAGNGDITGWFTKYEGVTYDKSGKASSYNRFIYTLNQPVDGDNALYIPVTAGLQFTCNANTFGLNNSSTINDDRHVSFKGNNNHDNVLTIPQLKQGQYVTIWWKPYSSGDDSGNGNAGSTFRVDNATDLAGTPITNKFSTTSINSFASNGSPRGQVTFRARYNGDMNFYIQDNGWNNIYKIRVSNKYSTDLRMYDGSKSKSVNAANNNISVLEGQTVLFKGDAGHTHSQAARYPRYTVYPIGNFVDGDIEATEPRWNSKKDNSGVWYEDLQLKVNGGTGNILVTQDICFGADKYVLDRSETYLAVGQRKQQTYPYTWDFTAYNMNKATDKTVDHLSSTTANAYGSWSSNALNDYTSVASPSGLKGYNIDKPLFANGSQLTYGTTTVRETEGLGVTLAGTGADYNGKVGIDGNTLALTAAGTQLTIPSVDAGMYVFVKTNQEPTVTNATKATPDNVSLPTTGEYVYKVSTKGDVFLTFPANTNVEKIGVTNIFKAISGKATSESRDRAIDYSQTGVFTNMGVKAYIATQYSDKSSEPDMGTLTLKDVTATPAETGLLLYKVIADGKTNETQTNFPLFVPAVNIVSTTEKGMLKPHVNSGTVQGSDANTLRYVFTNKYYHHGSSEQQTGDDYLFYRVEQSGTLAANKAYLELKNTSDAKQFIVMSFDDTPTGINTPHVAVRPSDGAYYTLQGVRVNGRPTRPGIYINNGKKVVVR